MIQINHKKVRIGAILFFIAPIMFLVIEAIVFSASTSLHFFEHKELLLRVKT
jgi:hypothetical protein